MDKYPRNTKLVLPNTPRVSEKIIEYYQKFGRDRDLEKFMRLYSPASSQGSENNKGDDCVSTLDYCSNRRKSRETICSAESCEHLAMMIHRPLSASDVFNSKSLPNIDVQAQPMYKKEYSPVNDLDTNKEKEKIISLSTPKKAFKNAKTQTPESVAKTHRRLEWDSLGDVGYKKSMSTSNISTMERSLLREFFKEKSSASEPGTSAPNREEPHIPREQNAVQKLNFTETEYSTPPLASSTLFVKPNSSVKCKMISQSTSTSLFEKFEKCVQTSFIKPPAYRSQETQCSMSSSNSMVEGTATPSSFDYYSSKSSKSSDHPVDTHKKFKLLEHPFISNITDILIKRKALGEKNQESRHQLNNIRELQTKFLAALNENKENQSHSTEDSSTITSFSLSKQAPELDLGIQLICSLIDAKSINAKQKKQLIHDIIRRIMRLVAEDHTVNASTINSSVDTTTDSSGRHHQHIYDSVRSNINNKDKQGNMNKLGARSERGISPITEQVNTEEKSSTPTTSASNFNCDLVIKEPRTNFKPKPINFSQSHNIQPHQDKSDYNQLTYKKNQNDYYNEENNANVSSFPSDSVTVKRSKDRRSKQTAPNHDYKLKELEKKYMKTSTNNKTNRFTQTSKTSTTSTSVVTTPDLPTQKIIVSTNNELNNSNTDAEQPTMREWLNPLTQSEIEYEEKKQIEMKKKAAAQQEKLMKKSIHDCGREQQINWIENEIKRLECLKHLLIKDETNTKSSSCFSSLDNSIHKALTKDTTQTDKLYDSVYSEKSLPLSESADQLIQEIEIILEESHEDVINLKDNVKRTKDRKRETHLIYKKEEDLLQKNNEKIAPKFRVINENTHFHEEQLLNGRKPERSSKKHFQREKIDTPSTDKSLESESLGDMVRQRKHEFLEAYRSKRQHHYDALKHQQQKEDFKYLNIQRKLSEIPTTTTDSEHYSVPHTLPRKYVPNNASYYTHHPLPLTPPEKAKLKPLDTLREHIIYSTTSTGQQQSAQPNSEQIINATSTNTNSTTTTASTSSMFCMSSDVSVPMGSQNTSSTPTTTHQYDDVAAVVGVAVQTSDSILRSKPIYETKSPLSALLPYTAPTSKNAACIQVKPKGVAYVIEFDDNKLPISNSNSDTDINSNIIHTNTKSRHSTATEVTNNLKPLLPTEPLLTLQDYLEKNKPKFLQHSQERKAILKQLHLMRQERDRQLREIIDNTSLNSLDRRLQYLPPPPIQKVRILSSKEKKALTNKRFASLPEVVSKHEREIEEKKRRSNRILKDVFNRRLQNRVRSGKLSLNQSKTII